MFSKMNGWMRIWIVFSGLWALFAIGAAFTFFSNSSEHTKNAGLARNRAEQARSEIRALRPDWDAWDEGSGWERREHGLPVPDFADVPRIAPELQDKWRFDPYVAEEWKKAWNAMSPAKQKEFLTHTPKMALGEYFEIPQSIKHFGELEFSIRMSFLNAESEVRSAKGRMRDGFASLLAAPLVPLLILGFIKALIRVFRWIWQGFRPDPGTANLAPPSTGQSPVPPLRSSEVPLGNAPSPTPISVPALAPAIPEIKPEIFSQPDRTYLYASEPWSRIWAYALDTTLLSAFATAVVLPGFGFQLTGGVAQLLGMFLSWTVIPVAISICQSKFGTTPGKAFFRMRVQNRNGMPPSFGEAFSRNFQVLTWGLFGGIPIVYLFGVARFAKHMAQGKKPEWDRHETMAYQIRPESKQYGKMWSSALLIFMVFALLRLFGEALNQN